MVKHTIKLEWKEFNVNLGLIEAAVKALDANYCGNSAASDLQLHFLEVPSQEVQDEIASLWDSLTEESEEAAAYQSQEDIAADIAAKKASAKAKLLALGLTEEEVAAISG